MITMAPPATTHQPDHKLAEAIPPQLQPHQSHNTNQSHSSGSTSRSLATPLRSLTISKPKAKIESGGSNKFRPTIIVVTKFPFTAESSNELSVNKGEILKLLDEIGRAHV